MDFLQLFSGFSLGLNKMEEINCIFSIDLNFRRYSLEIDVGGFPVIYSAQPTHTIHLTQLNLPTHATHLPHLISLANSHQLHQIQKALSDLQLWRFSDYDVLRGRRAMHTDDFTL